MKLFNLMAIATLFALQAHAQLDSCNVFLQGNYVEAAINWNGAFGSGTDAPISYISRPATGIPNSYSCGSTPRSSARELALVADPDMDGWLVGSPAYYGDFTIPGSPQEGWSIMMDGVQANAWNGAGYNTYKICDHNISGSNISYVTMGRKRITVWQGIYTTASNHRLQITQTTTLDTTKLYLALSITLKNLDTGTCRNVYYLRTLDPDNDVTLSADYTTRNVITSKLPNAKNKVVVSMWGVHYPKAFLALGTEDCRAKGFVCTNNLWPTSRIDSIYNGVAPNVNYDSLTQDVGTGLLFSLGNIASGNTVGFSYSYAFTQAASDEALSNSVNANWSASGVPGLYNSGDTIHLCRSSVASLSINNNAYNNIWNWSSPTGNLISPTTGTTVTATTDTAAAVFIAIGSSSVCTATPDTIRMVVVPHDTIPNISINGPYGQLIGNNVVINASIANAGTGYTIVWRKNGKIILVSTSGTSITYVKSWGTDLITATIIPSNPCYDSAVSNTLVVYNNLDVQQLNTSGNIQVYPNPFTNEMTISALSVADQITVYDIMGRNVQNWIITKEGSNTFNTATLLQGMYILRVLDKNGSVKARLPIQKL